MEDKKYTNPHDGLYEIVGDLWSMEKLQEAAEKKTQADSTKPVSLPASQKTDRLPSFDMIYKTADESIDWTDIISGRTLPGIDPASKRGQFLSGIAGEVLAGSLPAYASVLQEVRPLDDMKPYAHRIRVRALSADEVQVTFAAFPEDAALNDAQYAEYLCGIALRCARDIFAVLPVTSVHVTASAKESEVLDVTFSRAAFARTRFSFIDPVGYVREQGAVLHV